MKECPKISVIMCTYNHEKYIAQAIESVLMQQCEVGYELLIGDDCSTDKTREIINSYAEKNNNIIRVIYPEHNLGATENTLSLIAEAHGDILSFCDGDDYYLSPQILQKQYNAFQKNNELGMFCAKARCFYDSLQIYNGTLGYDGATDLFRMMQDNMDVAAPTISFRTSLFRKCIEECEWYIKKNYFFDSVWAYWFALFSKVEYCDEELAAYRILSESGCHTDDKKTKIEYERRYFEIKWRFLLEHPLPINQMHRLLMKDYDESGDFRAWMADITVRSSKAYKLGKMIINPIKRK